MSGSADQRQYGQRPDMRRGGSPFRTPQDREHSLLKFAIEVRPHVAAGQTAVGIAHNPMSYTPFRETCHRLRKAGQLHPGKRITDDNVEITFVRNNGLRPDQFKLRPQDKSRRGRIPPGLSASIKFTDDPEMISVIQFGEPLGEQEFAYKVRVGELREIGLQVVLDSSHNFLHVNVAPIRNYDRGDIPEGIRKALADLLRSPGHRMEDPMLPKPTTIGSNGTRVWNF